MSLKKIERKIYSEKRLSSEDAIRLFNSDDIFTIGRLASHVARRKNGNKAYFVQNRHINPTNICVNRCKFCAFSRSKGENGAYELSIKDIISKLKAQNSKLKTTNPPLPPFDKGGMGGFFKEVHIVGGLHPDWQFDFYLTMLKEIKKSFPHIHIKAFTAVEIDYFSRISGLSLADTLKSLKNAGLDSIPGGGAEIFDPQVRNKICPEKINGRKWLEIMEAAHKTGIRSNATMLYGHLETYEHRIEHMLRLRDLQDRTGGFQAFIPLAFHPKNTELGVSGQACLPDRQGSGISKRKKYNSSSAIVNVCHYTSGIDDLKTIAISRLFLDNFQHIKAYWIMLGEKIAQLALLFGADDLDGTVIEEKITHSAGALSENAMTRAELVNLIKKAGKVPVERDSFYKTVMTY